MRASHPIAQFTNDFSASSDASAAKTVIRTRSPNRARQPGTIGSSKKPRARSANPRTAMNPRMAAHFAGWHKAGKRRQVPPVHSPERRGRRQQMMPKLLATFALPASFVVTDVAIVTFGNYDLGVDATIYTLGAQALLAGADPWDVSLNGIVLAAPPSSIVAYCLPAWLRPPVAAFLWVAAALAAAVWAVRRLGLKLWWLLFPPLFVAVWNGGLDAFVPAAYLAAPAVAPFLKPYAVAGLIAERK